MRNNRLMALMGKNRNKGSGLGVVKNASEATVYVYDVLVQDEAMAEFFGGVAPEPFVREITEIDAETINVRINSPGGDVFAARPMQQALADHPARIVTHVDGYAASAASLLALSGDDVVISPGGFFMIHNAWSLAVGDKREMAAAAELLEQIDDSIRADYVRRTSLDDRRIAEMMDAETWIGAEQAVEWGFADTVADGQQAQNRARAWDLSAYEHAPKQEPRRRPTQAMRNKVNLLMRTG